MITGGAFLKTFLINTDSLMNQQSDSLKKELTSFVYEQIWLYNKSNM